MALNTGETSELSLSCSVWTPQTGDRQRFDGIILANPGFQEIWWFAAAVLSNQNAGANTLISLQQACGALVIKTRNIPTSI
jgi:hypothetical protein